jgi:hypothetical protein
MDPRRWSVPEEGAYRMLREAVKDLHRVERTLAIIDAAAPDPTRADHLRAIRTALDQLKPFLRPLATP